MAFESLSEFFNMGGHGLYVWLSYGLGLVIILTSVLLPLQQGKAQRRSLYRRFQREGDK